MKLSTLFCAAAVSLALAGCKGNPPLPAGSQSGGSITRPSSGDIDPGVRTNSLEERYGPNARSFQGATEQELELLNTNLVVYFEFDSSDIEARFNAMLAAHGAYLASNPAATVRLEGHADERGSREYNIGLGERRAQAVRQILLLQGASATQLTTVSYGEERPAVFGSDEEAYGLNRRVEIVYR